MLLIVCLESIKADEGVQEDILQVIDTIDFLDEPVNSAKPPFTKKDTLGAFTRTTRACSEEQTSIINLQGILRNDFYIFTHPIAQRSIHDYPQFYFFSCLAPTHLCKCWQLQVTGFYNQEFKANFTKDSPFIPSYLNFNNPTFIQELDNFAALLGLNTPRLFSLLSKIKLQERRGGIMFGAIYHQKHWFLEVRTPLEYFERNFYLTESEKREVEAEPIFNDQDPDTQDDEEVDKFAKQHLVADRFGIGDTRINAWRRNIDTSSMIFDTGFVMTLPTAYSFKKGLIGSHFSKNTPTPSIDLTNLLNLVNEGQIEQATAIVANFSLAALDRLSRILLENSLGNNGHVGLGAFLHYDATISQKFSYRTRIELEYLLPIQERRFYIKKKDQSVFDRLADATTPAECAAAVDFIEQQLVNTLFPTGYATMVYPGLVFKLCTGLNGRLGKHWKLTAGSDVWWQQEEQLGTIKAPQEVIDTLRVDLARRSYAAFQLKIWGNIGYFRTGKWCDWSASLYGDRTILRSGIGKDYSVGIRFEFYV